MTVYQPGIYRTLGGTVYHFDGSTWVPFSKSFKEREEEFETYGPPEEEMVRLGEDSAIITQVKEWWSKTSRVEGVDWNSMIELGEILMKGSS